MTITMEAKQETKSEVASADMEEATIKYEEKSAAEAKSENGSNDVSMADQAFQDAVVPDGAEDGLDKFTDSIMEALSSILSKYGSCGSFLHSRFSTQAEVVDFVSYLHTLFEAAEPQQFLDFPLPSHSISEQANVKPIKLPLGAFSIKPSCSLKPDADHQLVFGLAKMILKQGFLSAAEPLLVTGHAELYQEAQASGVVAPWKGPLLPQCVGFLKGKARMHTLLTILAVCFDNSINLTEARQHQLITHFIFSNFPTHKTNS